jgi:hypothetical protein
LAHHHAPASILDADLWNALQRLLEGIERLSGATVRAMDEIFERTDDDGGPR